MSPYRWWLGWRQPCQQSLGWWRFCRGSDRRHLKTEEGISEVIAFSFTSVIIHRKQINIHHTLNIVCKLVVICEVNECLIAVPADRHGDDNRLPARVEDFSGGWDLPGYQYPYGAQSHEHRTHQRVGIVIVICKRTREGGFTHQEQAGGLWH